MQIWQDYHDYNFVVTNFTELLLTNWKLFFVDNIYQTNNIFVGLDMRKCSIISFSTCEQLREYYSVIKYKDDFRVHMV